MNVRVRSWMAWVGLFCGLAVFIGAKYGPLVVAPNAGLLASNGDGIKNYYTFLYHVRHDRDETAFSGMNYPFGEHVVYTDGMPLLGWCLRRTADLFPSAVDGGAGVMAYMFIAAIAACAIAMFALLRSLGVREGFAVACALGITVLAPPWVRITGHFGLGLACAIPASWLLLLRVVRHERWLVQAVVLALVQCAWLGMHPYLGAMTCMFAGLLAAYGLVSAWRTRTGVWRWLAALVGGCALPICAFVTFMGFTDTHAGRSRHPSGFFGYTAEPDDVLIPWGPPLRPLIDALSPTVIKQQWEALAYIGLGTILVIIAWPWLRYRRRRAQITVSAPMELRAALFAAFMLLLFAFCLPFKEVPGLLRYAPVLEQFRTTGRFTWPFYFVITTWAAWSVDRWFSRSRGIAGPIHWSTYLLPLCLVVEGWHIHAHPPALIKGPNLFLARELPPDTRNMYAGLGAGGYQAIVPMPYFNFGSESFTRPSVDGITQATLFASYHLGLPIAGSILSRVSVPESRMLTQLVSPSIYPKQLAQFITDQRPFLIVRDTLPLSVHEEAVVARSVQVGEADGLRYYRLERDRLFEHTACAEFERIRERTAGFVQRDGYLVPDSSARFFAAYDGTGGEGSWPKKGYHTIAGMELNGAKAGERWVLSAWMDNAEPEALNMALRFVVACSRDGRTEETMVLPNESEVLDGYRTLVEVPFTVIADDPELEVRLEWPGHLDRTLRLDHLLVRPIDQDVARSEPGSLPGEKVIRFNNQRIACTF